MCWADNVTESDIMSWYRWGGIPLRKHYKTTLSASPQVDTRVEVILWFLGYKNPNVQFKLAKVQEWTMAPMLFTTVSFYFTLLP